MAKQKTVDLERFSSIRARIVDLYQYSGQSIRDKKTVTTAAIVFAEQKWLVDEIERVAKGPVDPEDATRYAKVKAFVLRTYSECEGAIKSGEFIKVSAGIFGASRFLIKCLERIVFAIDEEAAAALVTAAKMPDAKKDRIEIPLDEDISDTPDETERAIEDVGGVINTEELVGAGAGDADDDI